MRLRWSAAGSPSPWGRCQWACPRWAWRGDAPGISSWWSTGRGAQQQFCKAAWLFQIPLLGIGLKNNINFHRTSGSLDRPLASGLNAQWLAGFPATTYPPASFWTPAQSELCQRWSQPQHYRHCSGGCISLWPEGFQSAQKPSGKRRQSVDYFYPAQNKMTWSSNLRSVK